MRTGQGSVQSAPFQPSLTPPSPEVTGRDSEGQKDPPLVRGCTFCVACAKILNLLGSQFPHL